MALLRGLFKSGDEAAEAASDLNKPSEREAARTISQRTGASIKEAGSIVRDVGGGAARDFARGVERSAKHVTRNPNALSGRQKAALGIGVAGGGAYASKQAQAAYAARQRRQSVADNTEVARQIANRDDLTPEEKRDMLETVVSGENLEPGGGAGGSNDKDLWGKLTPDFIGFNGQTFFLLVVLYFGTKMFKNNRG